jgi:hypothetical protein
MSQGMIISCDSYVFVVTFILQSGDSRNFAAPDFSFPASDLRVHLHPLSPIYLNPRTPYTLLLGVLTRFDYGQMVFLNCIDMYFIAFTAFYQ